jgi:SagB-type dehydrogenase family enzyme
MRLSVCIYLLLALAMLGAGCAPRAPSVAPGDINLPAPTTHGARSLEEVIAARRSVREYADRELTWAEISQLLWAAQGITSPQGLRAAPSAGALYPLEIYVAVPAGVYHYQPAGHRLERTLSGDRRRAWGDAAVSQGPVYHAPATFLIAGVMARTRAKYGERAERYVYLEAGHAAQNLLLQATALGLGAVPIGAFYDEQLAQAAGLPADETPLYLICVGAMRQ